MVSRHGGGGSGGSVKGKMELMEMEDLGVPDDSNEEPALPGLEAFKLGVPLTQVGVHYEARFDDLRMFIPSIRS